MLESLFLKIHPSRLLEAWHGKRMLLVEVVQSLLDEGSLGVRKALAEVTHVYVPDNCFFIL